MRRRAREARASTLATSPASRAPVDGRCRPTDQEAQSPVLGPFLSAIGQRIRMNSAEHRSTARIDDSDDDLGAARRVEDDAFELGAATSDRYEITWAS